MQHPHTVLAMLVLCALLLAAASPALAGPCNGGPFSSAPFCDSTLSVPIRVQDFLSHISLSDKLAQFVNSAGPMPSVDMPAYQWWSEVSFVFGVATSFLITPYQ